VILAAELRSRGREPLMSGAYGRRLSHDRSLSEPQFSGREAHEEADWAPEGARALSILSLSSLMTAAQLSSYKALRSEISAARSDYHAALSAGSPASVRHEAESRCSAAMAAMQEWQATL
jgi:hypothetical protein